MYLRMRFLLILEFDNKSTYKLCATLYYNDYYSLYRIFIR